MIRIASIAIAGQCDAGKFAGCITFDKGLQIITAPNRFGKSLIFAAATWCLGVEQIYGVRTGDNAIFPDAVRRALEIDGKRDVPVQSSEACVVLERQDGERLTLRRSIMGGDVLRIHFAHGATTGDLRIGYGASSDGTKGFQAKFREWSGLPERRLVRTQGGEFPIYLENIAPLFLIEQLRGWTSIQAEQVYQYGLQDVADAAFEYLLGLDKRLKSRFEGQRAQVESGGIREEGRMLAEQFRELLAEQGWVGALPGVGGDLAQAAERWAAQTLDAYVVDHFNYSFAKENEQLKSRHEALKAELARPTGTNPTPASVQATQQLIELKVHRDKVQRQIGVLRNQLKEHKHVLSSLEDRLVSAKDLKRLKQDGLGILPIAECPTCQQSVSPDAIKVDVHSTASIAENVASLERQRRVLKQGIERIHAELLAAGVEDQSGATAIAAAERALSLTQQAVGADREKTVKLATEIMDVERDMDRNRRFQTKLSELQKSATAWIERASRTKEKQEGSGERPPQLDRFEEQLRSNVAALGVGGVDAVEAKMVGLGRQHYSEVVLGDRALPAYGSASDRARLVMSYVLALLGSGTQHPGFVLLDEPIQQNPDETHRAKWVEYLRGLAALEGRQIVVLTSLKDDERASLSEKVPLQALKGRFLSVQPPEPALPPDDSKGPGAVGQEGAGASTSEAADNERAANGAAASDGVEAHSPPEQGAPPDARRSR